MTSSPAAAASDVTGRPIDGVAVVQDLLSDWAATRAVITEMVKGHPRDLCWICEKRPRVTYTPGIPAGMCAVCRDMEP
ncbi:hypothetical protein [Prescottella equi]